MDRHLPAAERQRTARHAAERLQRQRHPERRRSHVHGGEHQLRERRRGGDDGGCVTADPLFDPTDFTPGGGDTGTVLISPLIKPGTVSSTYYNHYSMLRTLEDLFLTGTSCTNPPTPTPRWPRARSAAASTARATSATRHRPGWPASGRTSSPPSTSRRCPGYKRPSSGSTACTAPDVNLGRGPSTVGPVTAATPERRRCGTGVATPARWQRRQRRQGGHGGNGGNGGNGSHGVGGVWLLHRCRHRHPALNGTGGIGGKGGNGVGSTPGGNGGNGGNGSPGVPGQKGTGGEWVVA